MGPPPAPEDRKGILEMAESGLSQRQIAERTGWSRPTISKVLRYEGFGNRNPRTREEAQPEQTIDIDAVYAEADRQAAEQWARWLKGEDWPTYGSPFGRGPS